MDSLTLDSQLLLSTPGGRCPNFMTKTENLLGGQNVNFDSFARSELKNRYDLNTQMLVANAPIHVTESKLLLLASQQANQSRDKVLG